MPEKKICLSEIQKLLYYSPHYKINHILLLSEVEKEINMLEQSRVPCTKFEGVHAASEVITKFEGVHAASEVSGLNLVFPLPPSLPQDYARS